MAAPWEPWLTRWQKAELLDDLTVRRIRDFEAATPSVQGSAPAAQGFRWPIVLALACGAILLAAGILLFVSAHWDSLSPSGRMTVVVGALAIIHLAGAWFADRFPALSTTLHAVGTIACGAGIFLAAQIFNIEGHWPNGILLWIAGAAAGWWLLRDWPHWTLLALLVPLWVSGELFERADHDGWPTNLFLLLMCFAYLGARSGPDRDPQRRALAWIGGLGLLPATLVVGFLFKTPFANWAVAAAIGLPLLAGFLLRRWDAWPMAGWAVWAVVLTLLSGEKQWILLHAWCALGSVALAAWGIKDSRPERVNLGLAGFAITVGFFYFSTLMDKLGRSASLIGLGILFLGGGWALERLRRQLLTRIGGPA